LADSFGDNSTLPDCGGGTWRTPSLSFSLSLSASFCLAIHSYRPSYVRPIVSTGRLRRLTGCRWWVVSANRFLLSSLSSLFFPSSSDCLQTIEPTTCHQHRAEREREVRLKKLTTRVPWHDDHDDDDDDDD